jgi:hypothetical protein
VFSPKLFIHQQPIDALLKTEATESHVATMAFIDPQIAWQQAVVFI